MWIAFLWMLAAVAAAAQDKPVGLFPSLQQNVEKRTTEWDTLANNLEVRIGRMLPCDPRVRGAVEEVSRASEARIVALTEYWLAVSAASKTQTEAIRRLLAQEDASAAERKTDQADAEQEQVAVSAQLTDLGESAKRLPSLAAAQRALDGLAQSSARAAAQAAERGQSAERLSQELRDLLAAAQARQTAIDNAMKALEAEGLRWNGYYSSRQARAQTECTITLASRPVEPPPRKSASRAPVTTAQQQPAETPKASKSETAKAEPVKSVKTEKAEREEATKLAPASGSAPSGTYLQLAAGTKAEVDIMVDVLRQKKFAVITAEVPEKPGLFRVLVGPLVETQINKTKTDLQSAGFPGDKSFTRRF